MSSVDTSTMGMNPRACGRCGRNYTLALNSRLPNSRPYLLQCGHVFCGICLQERSTLAGCGLVCPACKMVMKVPEAGGLHQLQLDYYAFGVVAANKYAGSVPQLKQNRASQVKSRQLSLLDRVLLEPQGILDEVCLNLKAGKKRSCAECGWMKANLCCQNCQEDFCDSCFKKVHGHSKVLKNHKTNRINPSGGDVCDAHNKPYTYYCELDGGSVLCDDCIAHSEHVDHSHTPIEAKKKDLSLQFPKAIVAGQAGVLKLKDALQEFENLQSRLQLQRLKVACGITGMVHAVCAMVQARGAELVIQLKDMEDQLDPILTTASSILHEAVVSNCMTLNTAFSMAQGQQYSLQEAHKVVGQLLAMDIPELCAISLENPLDLQCDLDTTQLMSHIKELGSITLPTRILECGQSMSAGFAAAGFDFSPARVALPPSVRQQLQPHHSPATFKGCKPRGPITHSLKLALTLQGRKQVAPRATWSEQEPVCVIAQASPASSIAHCHAQGNAGGMIPAGAESSFGQKRQIGNMSLSHPRPSWISQDAIHSEQVTLAHVVNPELFYVRYYAARYQNERLHYALDTYCKTQTKHSPAMHTLNIGEVVCMRSCVNNRWHRVKIISIECTEDNCGFLQAEGEGTTSPVILENTALQTKELISSTEGGIRADVHNEQPVTGRGSTAEEPWQTSHAVESSGSGPEAEDLSLYKSTRPECPHVCGLTTILQKSEDINCKCTNARGENDLAKQDLSTEKSVKCGGEMSEMSEENTGDVSDENNSAAPDPDPVMEAGPVLLAEDQASSDTQSVKPSLVSQGVSFPIDKVTRLKVFLVDEGRTEAFYVGSGRAPKQSGRIAESMVSDLRLHIRLPDRNLLELFEQTPAAAVRCALKDVVPFVKGEGWSAESSRVVADMLQGQIVHMVVTDSANDTLIVDLIKSPHSQVQNDVPESLRDALVFLGLARFRCEYTPTCTPTHRPSRSPAFIPPSQLQPLMWMCVVLSHISSPSDFYVQQVSSLKCLLELKSSLHGFYREYCGNWQVMHPSAGQLCVAQFSSDHQWYRAEVIGLPGRGDVEVRYVDYGNKERISVSRIRKLAKKFLQLPELAVPCALADIRAEGGFWTVAAKERFLQIVDNTSLWCLVTGHKSDGNKVLVHLFVEPAQLVCNMLVAEGFAQATEDCAISTEKLRLVRERAQELANSPEGLCAEFARQSDSTRHKTRAFVSSVKSPASFYLQPDEALGSILPRLKALLEERLGGKPQPLVTDRAAIATQASSCDVLSEGLLCAVYSVNHRTWARTRIISRLPDNYIQVLLLDYGDVMVVEPCTLRRLDAACSRYPPMAVHCCLADLTPTGGSTEWSAGACDFLSDNISEKYCFVKERGEMETDDPLPVQLTCIVKEDRDHLKDVGDMLVLKGLAFRAKRPTGASSVMHKRMGDYFVASVTREEDRAAAAPPERRPRPAYSAPVVPAAATFRAVVSHVSPSGRFYARLASHDAVLQKIMDSIQSEYGNNSVSGHVDGYLVSGQPCVVQLSGCWYRAEILAVHTDTLQVRYVDYGGEEEVERGAVRVTNRFTHVPALCLVCELRCLRSDEGDTMKDKVVEYLSNVLFGQTVTMTLKAPCTDASQPLLVDIHMEQGSPETLVGLVEPPGERYSLQAVARHSQWETGDEMEQMDTEDHVQLREDGQSNGKESFESIAVNVLQEEYMGEGAAVGSTVGESEEKRDELSGSGDQDDEENVLWDDPLVFTLQPTVPGNSNVTLPSPGHDHPVTVTHMKSPNQV